MNDLASMIMWAGLMADEDGVANVFSAKSNIRSFNIVLLVERGLPLRYACRKCGKTYSSLEYLESKFCRDCETFLMRESKVSKLLREKRGTGGGGVSKRGLLPERYEIRKGQKEFIEEAVEAMRSGGVFYGSAPCGIGKSLASLLAVTPFLKDKKLMICFRTRNQLDIYLKELRALHHDFRVASFFSKQDMCPLRVKGTLSYFDFFEECKRLRENCESSTKPYCRFYWNNVRLKKRCEMVALDCAGKIVGPWEAVRQMAKQGFCAYEALKKILYKVDIFLGTYHYVFNPDIRRRILNGLGVDLSKIYVIVDEAHNIPSFARELLSDQLSAFTVDRALKEAERFEHEAASVVMEHLTVLESIFNHAQDTLKPEELKQLSVEEVDGLFLEQGGFSMLEAAETLLNYGEEVKEKRRELGLERILSYNLRVGHFLKTFFESDSSQFMHLVSKDRVGKVMVEVRSFDGREITDSVLHGACGSILMSGFLSPPKVYRDLTLHNQDNVYLKEYDSPFPPENRIILAARDVSSEYRRRSEKMLGKWKKYIEAASQANQGNIAVFFTSYGLMHKVLPLIETNRRIIVEEQKTRRSEVIELLCGSSENALFGVMGGKFSEGIDYPNNALTCVVAVGLPYATWGIYEKGLISYLEHHFPENGKTYAYLAPAILRLIQTCGRVHRSADDKGCIVILDGRLTLPNIRIQLPNYYQREMKIVGNPDICAREIEDFWFHFKTRSTG